MCLALAFSAEGNADAAMAAYQDALRLDPNNDLARRALDALVPRQPEKR